VKSVSYYGGGLLYKSEQPGSVSKRLGLLVVVSVMRRMRRRALSGQVGGRMTDNRRRRRHRLISEQRHGRQELEDVLRHGAGCPIRSGLGNVDGVVDTVDLRLL